MTVIISDKAALFVSLFVYHGGRLSMLLPVAYMQTEYTTGFKVLM